MRRFIAWATGIVVAVLLLGCAGLALPIDLAFNLVFGWVFFLGRVPNARVSNSGIATALTCLALLSVGLHRFLGWLHAQLQGQGESPAASRWKRSWTASSIAVILLMFLSGLASVGVAHQAGWLLTSGDPWVTYGGEARGRSHSTNNLKQIGLGLYHYHESMASFPPGGTFDRQGRAFHGWQAATLPYFDSSSLYNSINFNVPWDDPSNSTSFRTAVDVYLNPKVDSRTDQASLAPSHYAGNALVLGGDIPRSLKDVSDGTGSTIMAGEVATGFKPWGSPRNWRDPAKGINRTPDSFGSPFTGGASILFVDGSVRFVKNSVDPRIMKGLATPSGGEEITSDSY